MRRRPGNLLTGLLLIAAGVIMACSSSTKEPDQVHVLKWDGAVNPVMARYFDRGVDEAEKSQARAVVLMMDTPGGLDSSMRDIIQRIQSSRVPVIVYVAPAGGRAASAGTFITMAGHVAAMAPNTTIGAATPINSTGEDIPGALGRKVTNDAVAYIRGIAELRERNADWAESAVRDAASINQGQAIELDVIDFVATSVEDVLTKSDGRQVQVAGTGGGVATVTLRTAAAPILVNNTGFFEEFLNLLASPDIAFLLLTLGGLMLVAEIWSPGFGIGIFGALALVLAYFSLGTLPTNWTGVGLILFGFVLIGAELAVTGHAVLGIGGILSVVFGGLILMSGNESDLQVSRWLIFGLAAVVAAVVFIVVAAIVKARKMPTHSGRESLLGAKGVVRQRLDPSGTVWVGGERWDATAEDPPIEDGAEILVTRTEGLRLRVKRDPASIKLLPAAPEAPTQA